MVGVTSSSFGESGEEGGGAEFLLSRGADPSAVNEEGGGGRGEGRRGAAGQSGNGQQGGGGGGSEGGMNHLSHH